MGLSVGEIVYTTTGTQFSFGKCVSALKDGRYKIQSIHHVRNRDGSVSPDKDDVLPHTFLVGKRGEHMRLRYKRYLG